MVAWEGPYEVNTCVCIEESDGVCEEWGKLSCTSCDSDGADCPAVADDASGASGATSDDKSSGAARSAIGTSTAVLVLLAGM